MTAEQEGPCRDSERQEDSAHRLPVAELSEGGMRILDGHGLRGPVAGKLEFSDGRTIRVAGRIGRRSNDVTVVRDLQGVTFAEMMNEQRRLVRIYPFMS